MSKYWNYKKLPSSRTPDGQVPALVNKPWRYADVKGMPPFLRNSPEPFHKVTHRAIGDIPGCIPAPPESIFKDSTLEECQAATAVRAEHWRTALMKYVNGEYGGDSGLEEMWKSVGRAPALFGPHGEKL